MTSCIVFDRIVPWTAAVRGAVFEILDNMAELDRIEVEGIRPAGDTPSDLIADLGQLVIAGVVLDGFIARVVEDDREYPAAFAMAIKGAMPRVAEVCLIGRSGIARHVPTIYRELYRRSTRFGLKRGIKIVQVPILKQHHSALRMVKSIGGEVVFDYGAVGTQGQEYLHTIWRL